MEIIKVEWGYTGLTPMSCPSVCPSVQWSNKWNWYSSGLNASILVWHTCASALWGWVLYRQLELTKLTHPDLHHVGGWVGLWAFLWWAPSAERKDHHGVSSGWSSVWHRSNTGLSSTQYEQIPIILGVWPFWLTPFFFRSITFWRANG